MKAPRKVFNSSPEALERARALIGERYNDLTIQQMTGVSRHRVRDERKLLGVPAFMRGSSGGNVNRHAGSGRPLICRDMLRRLYRRGLSDGAIAKRVGCCSKAVAEWRRAQGLPFHYDRPQRLSFNPVWRDPLWTRARRAIGYGIAPDMADDAAQDMVLAVLEGAMSEASIEAQSGRYSYRVLSTFARRDHSSIDEPDQYGRRLRDRIPDPATMDFV